MNSQSFSLSILLIFLCSPGKAQSSSYHLSDHLYAQLSGFYYVWFDNGMYGGDHLQGSLGYRLTDQWGLGVGAARWSAISLDSSRSMAGFGPHVQFSQGRWLGWMEIGVLNRFSIHTHKAHLERSLDLPKNKYPGFFRIQAAYRFLKVGIAGFSLSVVPQTMLEGDQHFFLLSPPLKEEIQKSLSKTELQFFIGIHLQKH